MSDQPSSTEAATPPPLPSAMPPATPPPFPPAAQQAMPPAPAKKKRHGCLIAFIVFAVLVLGVVGVGFAFISSMGKPRDLGVRYSIADYHSAAKKVGLAEFASAGEQPATGGGSTTAPTTSGGTSGGSKTGSKTGGSKTTTGGSKGTGASKPTAPTAAKPDASTSGAPSAPDADSGFTTDVTYSGSKPFDVVLTSAEMSALLNYSHMPGWPISDAQVLFSPGGGFQMSMYFQYGGVKYPVYASGSASIAGGALGGTATSAQVLGWTVPGEYLGPGGDYVLEVINSRMARLGTLNVTSAEVVDGGLHLVGTGPAKAQPIGQ